MGPASFEGLKRAMSYFCDTFFFFFSRVVCHFIAAGSLSIIIIQKELLSNNKQTIHFIIGNLGIE